MAQRMRTGLHVVLLVASILWRGIAASTATTTASLPPWTAEVDSAATERQQFLDTIHDEEDLFTWASRAHGHVSSTQGSGFSHDETFLLVGTKSSVVHGFAQRQAIRQTWASALSVPRGARVVFLGCEPNLSVHPPRQQQLLGDAIEREREVYGDLLTSELLDCEDSYLGLSDKVKAFFHWAAAPGRFPHVAYVMIADDDAYVRLDHLVELLVRPSTPRRRFYAGNAACDECRVLGPAIRDPLNKYFISHDKYPMYWLPPYLSGQHVIISRDLVDLLARNVRDLRGHGPLDDMAMGLWLFTMVRVQLTWLSEFQSLLYAPVCHDHLVSIGLRDACDPQQPQARTETLQPI